MRGERMLDLGLLARGAALTARLEAYDARHRSLAMDLSILLRSARMNLVGKRRGARALPPLPQPASR